MLIGDRGCTGADSDGSEPGEGKGQGRSWPFFCVFFEGRQVMTAHKFAIAKSPGSAETQGSL